MLLRAAGGNARIVAKIERSEAIPRLDEISVPATPSWSRAAISASRWATRELTGLQKTILQIARAQTASSITATQMMESMIHSPVPTRAEVSDVANAVLDGTDAVMLSGETAVGKYPVTGGRGDGGGDRGRGEIPAARSPAGATRFEGMFESTDEAIARAVMYTANHMDVEAIVALTESGLDTALDVAHPLRHSRSSRSRGTSARDAASRCIAASTRSRSDSATRELRTSCTARSRVSSSHAASSSAATGSSSRWASCPASRAAPTR